MAENRGAVYRKVAEQGHANARYRLDEIYTNSKGVPQECGEAIE